MDRRNKCEAHITEEVLKGYNSTKYALRYDVIDTIKRFCILNIPDLYEMFSTSKLERSCDDTSVCKEQVAKYIELLDINGDLP